jgi:hypothetical protein
MCDDLPNKEKADPNPSLHEYGDAKRPFSKRSSRLDSLIDDAPDETELHIQHARANYTLGRVYRDMNRGEEGVALIQLALIELESLPGDAPQRRHIQELLSRFQKNLPRIASLE